MKNGQAMCIYRQIGILKIIFAAIFCLYFTFCIALLSAFSYPMYAIKYILTAICPASLFVLIISISRGRLFKIIVCVQAIYMSIINIFLLYHTFLNGVPVANEGFFVIFESFSPDKIYENWGWIKSNFNKYGLMIIAVSMIVFYFITKKTMAYSDKRVNVCFVVAVVAIMLSIGLYKYKSFSELFSKYQQSAIFIHYDRYKDMISSMKDIKKYTDSISFNAVCSNIDKNPLYVIVIGESATNHHWGLYGYKRNTTPVISGESDIFVFENAVSTSSSTLMSLTNSLTIENSDNKKLSIVDFFNKSGFYTELYSNQPEGGQYDTALGYLFNNIKNKYYASKFGQYAKLDHIVVDRAIESIKNNNVPTVIFIHLLGSHVDFYDRYPKDFAVFTSDDIVVNKPYIKQNKKTFAAQRINSYDNSIRYTDFLLGKIIDTVRSTGRYSFVLYFSDHGEENFEFRDHFGRGGLNSTIVYDIPMIIWGSKDFLKENKDMLTSDILHRPVWMKNLLPSIVEISGIKSDQIEFKKSFFQKYFEEERRLCDEKDYDSLEGHQAP